MMASAAARVPLGAAARRIGVLGLARSGLAAARLALAAGREVYASDAGDSPALRAAADEVRALGGDAEAGAHSVDKLAACELLVLSPGIPPTAAVLREERLAAVPRVSELEYASRHLSGHVIAITGTNGKSTTTALCSQLLGAAGVEAPAAGNIGRALSEVALMRPQPTWVVVEASSFQLADVDTFAPAIGALTNLSPDHLDRYPSVAAYYADKARLFANATEDSRWILSGDDPQVEALLEDAPGRRYYVRVTSTPAPDERGAFLRPDGMLALEAGGSEVALVHTDELPLLGAHNVANALFAALAAVLAGADVEGVRRGLRDATPLHHRLEPVGEVDGVLWINDSKATNLSSTRVAIGSMTRPTVLLLGGRHKGEPYAGLLPEIEEHVTAVVAFGEAGERVRADLEGHARVVLVDGGFDKVVEQAAGLARPGDAVLLSPACASYDMFRDYEERGERFAELVRRRQEVPRGA